MLDFLKRKQITDSEPTIQVGDSFEQLYNTASNALQNGKDVLKNSTFSKNIRLRDNICENLFVDSWVAKKIVQIPVARAMAAGIVIEMDSDEKEKKIWKAYEDLKIKDLIIKAQISADIYGSSIVLLKDISQNATKQSGKFKNLEPQLVEYPFFTVQPSFNDPYKPGIINCSTLGINVDQSFVAPFIGAPVVTRLAPDYKYYGMSVYQNLWNCIINDSVIMTAVANITVRASIRHYKLKGLKDLVLAKKHDLALKRMMMVDASAGIFGSVVMDSDDEMQIMSQTLNGLADIDERAVSRLSAASGIPATELLGKSPDGQNSTGKSDQKNMVKFIKDYQEKMLPSVTKIFEALKSYCGLDEDEIKIYFKSPQEIEIEEKPAFDKTLIENAGNMIHSLGLPEDIARRYLLDNGIITQEEHDRIKLEVEQFDETEEDEANSAEDK